jgi:hypothetical protein
MCQSFFLKNHSFPDRWPQPRFSTVTGEEVRTSAPFLHTWSASHTAMFLYSPRLGSSDCRKTCPPNSASRSSTTTWWPRATATRANSRPEGPPLMTSTFLGFWTFHRFHCPVGVGEQLPCQADGISISATSGVLIRPTSSTGLDETSRIARA